MLDSVRPVVKPWVEKLAKPLSGVNPNAVTIAGFIFSLAYAGAMARGSYGWALIWFLGSLADMLDGTVARLSGKVSIFGAVLDATLDRAADGLMLMAFGWAGIVPWTLVGLTMLMSLVISYTRAKYEAVVGGGEKLAVGIIERPERLIVVGLGTLLLALGLNPMIGGFNLVTWLMMGLLVLSMVTVGQRLKEARRRLGNVKDWV